MNKFAKRLVLSIALPLVLVVLLSATETDQVLIAHQQTEDLIHIAYENPSTDKTDRTSQEKNTTAAAPDAETESNVQQSDGNVSTTTTVSSSSEDTSDVSISDRDIDGDDVKEFYEFGDVYVAFFVGFCENRQTFQTYLHTVDWLVDRINFLQYFEPLKLGYYVFQTCTEDDMLEYIFRLYRDKHNLLAIISKPYVPLTVIEICDILKLNIVPISTFLDPFYRAATNLINNHQDWFDHPQITVIASNINTLKEFYQEARNEYVCVTNGIIYKPDQVYHVEKNMVIFANSEEIEDVIKSVSQDRRKDFRVIAIPTNDNGLIKDLPEYSFIITPLQIVSTNPYKKNLKILPSSSLLEAANPILKIALLSASIMVKQCNETLDKAGCLKYNLESSTDLYLKANDIKLDKVLQHLDLKPLQDQFAIDVNSVEYFPVKNRNGNGNNTTSNSLDFGDSYYVKIGTFNIFNRTMEYYNNADERINRSYGICMDDDGSADKWCYKMCVNFVKEDEIYFLNDFPYNIRREGWVLAAVTISLLGIAMSVAIIMFLSVSICKKTPLEGNPTLTVILLIAVILTYAAVVPFAVTAAEDENVKKVCLARALSVTLTYTTVLSLILSRCVLLATVSIESEFMSHIPGPVQSLLCVLMVAVQGALNIQIITGDCTDLMSGDGYVYFLSYDMLLMFLLLCTCPMVAKSQRNYREGKYFMVTVVMLVIGWALWISAFLLLEEEWSDLVLCCGLLYTASVCLGTIFIPRTYLMTSAATRDRLTGTFPSLSASSALDLYHTGGNACHVYDCVNVAAVNSAMAAYRNGAFNSGTLQNQGNNVAQSVQSIRNSDIYEPPLHVINGDVDSYSVHENNSISTDKVTRF